MDNNNLYQGLIQIITIIILIIRALIQSKDYQTVIKKQPASSLNLTKASDMFPVPRDDDMDKHSSPIN